MNPQTIQINPNVISRNLDGEEVLLHLETGAYFGLNEVGSFIWRKIQSGDAADEILKSVAEEFDSGSEQASKDFSDFIQQLKVKGLLS